MQTRKENKQIPGHAVSFAFAAGTALFATAQLAFSESNKSAAIYYATTGLLFMKGVYDLHRENRLGTIYNNSIDAVSRFGSLLWQQPAQNSPTPKSEQVQFKPAL